MPNKGHLRNIPQMCWFVLNTYIKTRENFETIKPN